MRPFSLLIAFGVLSGLLLVGWRAPKKETIHYLDAGLIALIGALVCSRALAVGVNFTYYRLHPAEIYQVWLGGLSSIGALVGGSLVVLLISIWWKIPVGLLSDTLFPLAGAISIAAWLGCGLDSCSYGLPSTAWWALPSRDAWGILTDRVPVQLLGALLSLGVVWSLERLRMTSTVTGMNASLGLLGITTILFGLSYLRADPAFIWKGLRLDAWGALTLMIFWGIIVVVLLTRWRSMKLSNSHKKIV
jgi:prolipoprotein diacylglyceryltransferase